MPGSLHCISDPESRLGVTARPAPGPGRCDLLAVAGLGIVRGDDLEAGPGHPCRIRIGPAVRLARTGVALWGGAPTGLVAGWTSACAGEVVRHRRTSTAESRPAEAPAPRTDSVTGQKRAADGPPAECACRPRRPGARRQSRRPSLAAVGHIDQKLMGFTRRGRSGRVGRRSIPARCGAGVVGGGRTCGFRRRVRPGSWPGGRGAGCV